MDDIRELVTWFRISANSYLVLSYSYSIYSSIRPTLIYDKEAPDGPCLNKILTHLKLPISLKI